MKTMRAVAVLALLGLAGTPAFAWWSVGVRIGGPAYYHPWYRPYYGVYVAPPPVVVAPPPVVVQPAPIVQAAPVVQTEPAAQPAETAPPPAPVPVYATAKVTTPKQAERQVKIDAHLVELSNPDPLIRAEGASKLGQMRAQRTVPSLERMLASDPSPVAREAAARALGQIGQPRAVTALQQAALADTSADVRQRAHMAIEEIRTRTIR